LLSSHLSADSPAVRAFSYAFNGFMLRIFAFPACVLRFVRFCSRLRLDEW
jgi:hypothetical protein